MFSRKRSLILLFENDLKIVTDVCTLFPTAKTIIWPSWYQKVTKWRDFLFTAKADLKKKKDNKIKNPSTERAMLEIQERDSGFFQLVTQLLWPYCSPFLVSKAAGCRPRKQEKLIYLADGLKELLFPYACYGIKVLLSTSNSCQIFISFIILVASKMNVHFRGTGQGIRFEMFSIPPAGKSCIGRQR